MMIEAKSVAESVAETVVEPVVETVAEPVAETVAETVAATVVETVAEAVPSPNGILRDVARLLFTMKGECDAWFLLAMPHRYKRTTDLCLCVYMRAHVRIRVCGCSSL